MIALNTMKIKTFIVNCLLFITCFSSITPGFCKEKSYLNGVLTDVSTQRRYAHNPNGYGFTKNVRYYHVKVGNIVYTGYAGTKIPKSWIVGDPVKVRFNNKETKMYLKKTDGNYIFKEELKLDVVERRRA